MLKVSPPSFYPLIVSPEKEIIFKGPFTYTMKAKLILSNKNKTKIAFIIKTTTPKHYCARPNSGYIDGNRSLIISTMCQPFTYSLTEKLNHKFLVQYIYIDESDLPLNFKYLWNNSLNQIMETKIKCAFELSEPCEPPLMLKVSPPSFYPLIVSPEEEIIFKGPLTHTVKAELILRNKNKNNIAFKIKTTKPKVYCVQPNSGYIDGNHSLVISIMLQPFFYSLTEKLNHKVLVQCIYIDESNLPPDFKTLWNNSLYQIMETKIICAFELSEPCEPPLPQEKKSEDQVIETLHFKHNLLIFIFVIISATIYYIFGNYSL